MGAWAVTSGARLDSERLTLRAIEPADARGRYAAWMADPEVTRYLESRYAVPTVGELEDYIRAALSDPLVHFFAIELREDERHVGNIKLGPIDAHHRRADIGIIIGERDCWGRGVATEAVQLLSDWALGELGLEKVTAGAYSSNPGSVRAFQRAGFEIEAVRRRHYLSDDGWVDGVLLARFA
jgi:RimJ/RimL family protein N-acetyltransferase